MDMMSFEGGVQSQRRCRHAATWTATHRRFAQQTPAMTAASTQRMAFGDSVPLRSMLQRTVVLLGTVLIPVAAQTGVALCSVFRQ